MPAVRQMRLIFSRLQPSISLNSQA